MSWIKHVILDLAVTALIIFAVATDAEWARWVVIIYSALMVLLKLAGLRGPAAGLKLRPTGVPILFYHLLYAVNVVALALGRWWILAAMWLAIWVLSYIQQRKSA